MHAEPISVELRSMKKKTTICQGQKSRRTFGLKLLKELALSAYVMPRYFYNTDIRFPVMKRK